VNRIKPLLLLIFPLIILSCKEFDDSPKALINILLIDAPAQWDSVIVEIQGVELEFVPNGREGEIQKIFLPYEPGDKQVDVSQLVGGTVLPLARNESQLGIISGITLRLGPGNSLYLNDNRYPLALPTGQTDFFLPLSINLDQGISYDIILDFDLEKSIQVTNPNPLTLDFNPWISAFAGIGREELTGTTSPAELRPVIFAIQENDSISTHTNSRGNFLFRLEPGTYDLFIDPKDSRYHTDTIRDVIIESGKATQLDRITLTRK
jgi:hypothetical protein